MNKAKLRDKHHEMRRAAAAGAEAETEEKMLANLDKMPAFHEAKTIMMYWSKSAEAPTHKIVESLLEKKKKVVLPISVKKSMTLELYAITSTNERVAGPFGVMEPDAEKCRRVEPDEIDVAIVPGVAFDMDGHRLGHGLGFYDRFLKSANCPKIGLCFDVQIEKEPLPHEAHDVKMDYIVSEKRVLQTIG